MRLTIVTSLGLMLASHVASGAQQLLLAGTANTRCAIGLGDAPNKVYADADDVGLLHITYVPQVASAPLPDFTVNCTPDTPSAASTISGAAISAQQVSLRAQAAQPHPLALLRPALTGDPMAITQDQLLSKGYPGRPDRAKRPAAYNRWLSFVSKPGRFAKGRVLSHPGVSNQTLMSTTSQHWSGDMLTGPTTSANPYALIAGEFWMPTIQQGYAGNASMWVGLGGSSTNSLVQGGATLSVEWYPKQEAYVGTYYTWVEWYPNDEVGISNMTVSAGDDVSMWSWVGDANGSFNINGRYSWINLTDWTSGLSVVSDTGAPSNTPFDGSTAEWIVERPGYCYWFFGEHCGLYTVPDFATIVAVEGYAAKADDIENDIHDQSTDNSQEITLINSSGSALVTPYNYDGDIYFQWSQSQ